MEDGEEEKQEWEKEEGRAGEEAGSENVINCLHCKGKDRQPVGRTSIDEVHFTPNSGFHNVSYFSVASRHPYLKTFKFYYPD